MAPVQLVTIFQKTSSQCDTFPWHRIWTHKYSVPIWKQVKSDLQLYHGPQSSSAGSQYCTRETQWDKAEVWVPSNVNVLWWTLEEHWGIHTEEWGPTAKCSATSELTNSLKSVAVVRKQRWLWWLHNFTEVAETKFTE